MTKHFYKDINTKKIHWTRGEFLGWQQGGLFNAWYAEFATKTSRIFVPRYSLLPETKAELPPLPDETKVMCLASDTTKQGTLCGKVSDDVLKMGQFRAYKLQCPKCLRRIEKLKVEILSELAGVQ